MKINYGDGVSSQIALVNNSNVELVYVGSDDWSGHWYNDKNPQNGYKVPAKTGKGFLHVKTSGAATGSIGAVIFRFYEATTPYFLSLNW